jgi:hypothetical protein
MPRIRTIEDLEREVGSFPLNVLMARHRQCAEGGHVWRPLVENPFRQSRAEWCGWCLRVRIGGFTEDALGCSFRVRSSSKLTAGACRAKDHRRCRRAHQPCVSCETGPPGRLHVLGAALAGRSRNAGDILAFFGHMRGF